MSDKITFKDVVLYGLAYCTTCEEYIDERVEPDAEDYECPQCGNNTLMGADYVVFNV